MEMLGVLILNCPPNLALRSALCALCKSQFYLQIASHIIVGDNLKVQFS
ncbi:MAG: hypothetical protein ACJATP_000613 [Candidatus Azotimanducaceae bacterium]|jgi:hypothetical protein